MQACFSIDAAMHDFVLSVHARRRPARPPVGHDCTRVAAMENKALEIKKIHNGFLSGTWSITLCICNVKLETDGSCTCSCDCSATVLACHEFIHACMQPQVPRLSLTTAPPMAMHCCMPSPTAAHKLLAWLQLQLQLVAGS